MNRRELLLGGMTAAGIMLAGQTIAAEHNHKAKVNQMSDTIELVRFRLKENKTTADWLKANEKINEWVKRQPGFRFRSLSETADGEWIDMVYWASPEAAQAAAALAMNAVGDVFGYIDEKSMVMSHSQAHIMLQG